MADPTPKGKPAAPATVSSQGGAASPKAHDTLATVAAELAKVKNPSAAQRLESAIVNHLSAFESRLAVFCASEGEKAGALKRIAAAAEGTQKLATEYKERTQELVLALKENTKAAIEQKAATKELVTQLKVAGLVAAKPQAPAPPPAGSEKPLGASAPKAPTSGKPVNPGPKAVAPEKTNPAEGPTTSKQVEGALAAPIEPPRAPAPKEKRKKRSSSSSGSDSSSTSSSSAAEKKKKKKKKAKKAKASSSGSESPSSIEGRQAAGSGDESDALSTKAPSIPDVAANAKMNADLREALTKKGGFLPKTSPSAKGKSEGQGGRRPMLPPMSQPRGHPMVPPRTMYRPSTSQQDMNQYAPAESDGTDAEMSHYDPYYGQFDSAQAAYELARQRRGDLRRQQALYQSALPNPNAALQYVRRRQRRRHNSRHAFF